MKLILDSEIARSPRLVLNNFISPMNGSGSGYTKQILACVIKKKREEKGNTAFTYCVVFLEIATSKYIFFIF